jgi:hypothetical protein
MTQEVEKKEQTETEKEILWGVEERIEKKAREEALQKDLPRHWLRKYLFKTVPFFLFFILVGGIGAWINEDLIFLLVLLVGGIFMTIFFALAHADETPLRRYRLIRTISPVLRKIIERGPPPS